MLSNNNDRAGATNPCANLDGDTSTFVNDWSGVLVPFIEDMGDACGPDLPVLRNPSRTSRLGPTGGIPIAGDPLDQRGGEHPDGLTSPAPDFPFIHEGKHAD